MSSIHEQQSEDTRADLQGQPAVEKIREIVGKAPTGFFCTRVSEGGSGGTRPMNVRQVDDQGDLWFLSASDSRKNAEIARDPNVALLFQASEHSGFLQLTGCATVLRDRSKVHELWEPVIRTWFTEGKDDPRITVIRFQPRSGYYWDNKHGDTVAGIKMLIGAAIGRTLDDSVEGRVRP